MYVGSRVRIKGAPLTDTLLGCCVKTSDANLLHGIFGHVGSIALELLVLIPLLSNLRGMRNVFLHSLGRTLTLEVDEAWRTPTTGSAMGPQGEATPAVRSGHAAPAPPNTRNDPPDQDECASLQRSSPRRLFSRDAPDPPRLYRPAPVVPARDPATRWP